MKDIMENDSTYENFATGEPNYKRICEDSVRLMHNIKTKKLMVVYLSPCEGRCDSKDIEFISRIAKGWSNEGVPTD